MADMVYKAAVFVEAASGTAPFVAGAAEAAAFVQAIAPFVAGAAALAEAAVFVQATAPFVAGVAALAGAAVFVQATAPFVAGAAALAEAAVFVQATAALAEAAAANMLIIAPAYLSVPNLPPVGRAVISDIAIVDLLALDSVVVRSAVAGMPVLDFAADNLCFDCSLGCYSPLP